MSASLKTFGKTFSNLPDEPVRLPVLFVGHGAPHLTLGGNAYTEAWKKLGKDLPRPRAILCVSAHWLTRGTAVTAMEKPKTIHDFYGFPKPLYEITYPAPGSPELAKSISESLTVPEIQLDHEWGLDHGTWTVIRWLFPEADIPVLQLSIDIHQPPAYHFELGKKLAFLRKKGVLVIGSGNIVHNLRKLVYEEGMAFDWAREFDAQSARLLDERKFSDLVNYESLGTAARLSIPTPDHYDPLLYVMGMADPGDKVSFPVEGLEYGSTSMRSVLFA